MSRMLRTHDGVKSRRLGCILNISSFAHKLRSIDETISLIPRSEWTFVSLNQERLRCQDQGNQGSCNAAAATCVVEACRFMAGMSSVPLSRGNLYGQINGGRDEGSLLGDALEALASRGVVPNSVIGDMIWRGELWPEGWEVQAKDYRVLEAYYCPTFDHMATALLNGYLVDFGIMVGDRFVPNLDGWLPDYQGGYGGHAMAGFGLSQRGDGVWGIETSNSWGVGWGKDGWCYVPESYFENGWWADGWAVRAAVVNADDAPPAFTA